MASQRITINGDGGWQTVGVVGSLVSGQQLAITPADNQLGASSEIITYPSVEVSALTDYPGVDTGIDIESGATVSITATGLWDYDGWGLIFGPDGSSGTFNGLAINPSAYILSLLARIGSSGPWEDIGSTGSFVASGDGRLFLLANDIPGGYANNAGSVNAVIQVQVCEKILPDAPDDALVARIGSGAPFAVGIHYDLDINDSGVLQLSVNNCREGSISAQVLTDASVASENNSGSICTIAQETNSLNPIELRTGIKKLIETDLRLNTPAGELNFTRSYNQGRLGDSRYRYMGLGWSHNHTYRLVLSGTTPNRLATVHMPDGGILKLDEDGVGGHFDAKPGSSSILDVVASNYVLTAQDKSQFTFEASVITANEYRLKLHTWPNTEVWTYLYIASTDDLQEVNDGYGRKLQFSYVSNPGQYNHEKLWRVGDQNATGLSGSPTGRYVEFTYISEKSNGTAIGTPPKPMLSSVRDVRGNTWTYDWYGQDAGETDTNKQSFLVEVGSPSVDTTGDGTTDGSLTLQRLGYSYNTELAVNGGMEANSDWSTVNGSANQRSTTQVDTGTYSWHVSAGAAGQGIEGNLWNLVAGRTYTITARVYPISGVAKMQVPGTSAFDQVSSGTGAWQTITATTTPVSTTNDRKLQFVASGGTADFYVDSVSIIEANPNLSTIVQERGIRATDPVLLTSTFEFKPQGLNLTRETVAGKATTHYFSNGVYLGTANPALQLNSQELNGDYRPIVQVDANGNQTEMAWSSGGKHLDSVTDALNQQTLFDYNLSGASADTLNYSLDAEDRKTAFTYGDSSNPRLPTRIKVIDPDGTTVLRWQEFTYDSQGRTLTEKVIDPADGATAQQQVTRTYHTSGNGDGLLHTVTQEDIGGSNDVVTTYTYDSAGRVIKTQQSSNFGSCDISFTVYDAAGNVVATICNYDPGVNPDPTDADEAENLYDDGEPDKNRVTTYEYDPLGRRVKTVVNAGASFAVTTLTVYDALNRVIRTISNYVADVSVTDPYTEERGDFDHGVDENQNLVTDTFYNARGMVRKQIDGLDNVTLLGYDDAGRLVKTIQSASQPSYNNDYSGGSPDPTLGSYTPGSDPDEDIIATQAYDAAGNLVKTVDPLGTIHYTVYDALNRPVKTVRAAKAAATISLNPGDGGYDEDHDPRSDDYVPSADPDRDLIDRTEYDALGRVIRTQRLLENRPTAQWETMLYGYDTLGRQVKVIRSASNPTYDLAADPDLSAYSASSDPDQDIITQTAYDNKSRVLYTEDTLALQTWLGYDGLGRQVKTIINPVTTDTDGSSTDPRSGSYTPSGDADKDLITAVVYDTNGRVQSTQDMLGRVAYTVYDTLGRVVRSVTNYVPQSSTDPADWVWSDSNNRWEYGSSDSTAIHHGTDNDENIIADSVYDAQGRVSQTIDHRQNMTLYVYDVLGRRIKTITNYVVQGMTDPADWLWDAGDNRWEDGAGNAISFGSDNDQNRITTTTYDLAGRVTRTRDAAGIETRFTYDALGRRTQTIVNYVNGVYSSAAPDEDLINATTYNKGSQVVTTTDARGTQTAFAYDKAGRRLKITQAANNTPLASVGYTCYDKGGRVLRSIQNWIDNGISPDAKTGSDWDFVPEHNGIYADRNLINAFTYDLANRRIQTTDPLGNPVETAYFKDGQVQSMTDPENVVTQYRYDELRRRARVIQGYVANAEDPAQWVWDGGDGRWEKSGGTALAHGTDNDSNIVVDVTYDKAGRVLSLREPRGNETTYAYDGLDRRKSLTNPLSKTWSTAYADLSSGGSRVTMTYPGITGSANYPVQRDFDRLGRLLTIDYDAPTVTPNVNFTYDTAGNRAAMIENDGTDDIRKTLYGYDDVRRLSSVDFDINGDGSTVETVGYEYDAGGLRTKLTLPGDLDVVYTYDAKGQLISLTDWDSQKTEFAYDLARRHITTERANGLRSRYQHDAAGRLKRLRHTQNSRTLAHFEYEVDKHGNRIRALEALAHPTTTTDTTIAYNDKGLALSDNWSEVSDFKESSDFNASLKLMFLGDEATLTMGTGPDHSLYDVYVGGSLWQSFDGYAASAGQRDIVITIDVDSRKLQSEGPHLIEIRNRGEKNSDSAGYKLRFKQLLVEDRTWALQTVKYSYDKLSRLLEARYAPGANGAAVDADLLRRYLFTHDRAGNRLSQSVALNGGSPTVTNYTYNAVNQLSSGSATYDNNGNMTSDGSNSYTWDRANRMKTMFLPASTTYSYDYDGLGNRIKRQWVSGALQVVTQYLLDVQSGLPTFLSDTDKTYESGILLDTVTHRYVHSPRGIHSQQYVPGSWYWMLQDGLGSVRGTAKANSDIQGIQSYDPYGKPFGMLGNDGTDYGFTGEPSDSNGLLYLRARYYNPAAGVFTALDPFEGMWDDPMSINGYSYVHGNPVNWTDPSGEQTICTGNYCYNPSNTCMPIVPMCMALLQQAMCSAPSSGQMPGLVSTPIAGGQPTWPSPPPPNTSNVIPFPLGLPAVGGGAAATGTGTLVVGSVIIVGGTLVVVGSALWLDAQTPASVDCFAGSSMGAFNFDPNQSAMWGRQCQVAAMEFTAEQAQVQTQAQAQTTTADQSQDVEIWRLISDAPNLMQFNWKPTIRDTDGLSGTKSGSQYWTDPVAWVQSAMNRQLGGGDRVVGTTRTMLEITGFSVEDTPDLPRDPHHVSIGGIRPGIVERDGRPSWPGETKTDRRAWETLLQGLFTKQVWP